MQNKHPDAARFPLRLLSAAVALALAGCGRSENSGSAQSAPAETPAASSADSGQAEAAAPHAPDPANGRQLFMGTCIACHGVDARGLPHLGKDLVASAFVAGQSDAEMIAFLKHGRAPGEPLNTTGVAMPPKGGNPAFGDADLADLVAYLRTINRANAQSAGVPAKSARPAS